MAQQPMRGSCLCEGITFEISGEPLKVLSCYCLDCQKGAGGPCQSVSKRIQGQSQDPSNPENQVIFCNASDVLVKDPKNLKAIYNIEKTQSGKSKEKHFCGRCGCTLWTVPMHHGGSKWVVRVPLIDGG